MILATSIPKAGEMDNQMMLSLRILKLALKLWRCRWSGFLSGVITSVLSFALSQS